MIVGIVIGVVVGFIFGALVYRNNPDKMNHIIAELEALKNLIRNKS